MHPARILRSKNILCSLFVYHVRNQIWEPNARRQAKHWGEDYHVEKQQSVQWIRGAGHREGEEVLQPDAGIEDRRRTMACSHCIWPAAITFLFIRSRITFRRPSLS